LRISPQHFSLDFTHTYTYTRAHVNLHIPMLLRRDRLVWCWAESARYPRKRSKRREQGTREAFPKRWPSRKETPDPLSSLLFVPPRLLLRSIPLSSIPPIIDRALLPGRAIHTRRSKEARTNERYTPERCNNCTRS
jgi:hypothetical protein